MTLIVGIVSYVVDVCMCMCVCMYVCDLRIEVRYIIDTDKSKGALYKPLILLYESLKQLYISNKIEHFSY